MPGPIQPGKLMAQLHRRHSLDSLGRTGPGRAGSGRAGLTVRLAMTVISLPPGRRWSFSEEDGHAAGCRGQRLDWAGGPGHGHRPACPRGRPRSAAPHRLGRGRPCGWRPRGWRPPGRGEEGTFPPAASRRACPGQLVLGVAAGRRVLGPPLQSDSSRRRARPRRGRSYLRSLLRATPGGRGRDDASPGT